MALDGNKSGFETAFELSTTQSPAVKSPKDRKPDGRFRPAGRALDVGCVCSARDVADGLRQLGRLPSTDKRFHIAAGNPSANGIASLFS